MKLFILIFLLISPVYAQTSGGSSGGGTTIDQSLVTCSGASCTATATCPAGTNTIFLSSSHENSLFCSFTNDSGDFFLGNGCNNIDTTCVGNSSCSCQEGNANNQACISIVCLQQ